MSMVSASRKTLVIITSEIQNDRGHDHGSDQLSWVNCTCPHK